MSLLATSMLVAGCGGGAENTGGTTVPAPSSSTEPATTTTELVTTTAAPATTAAAPATTGPALGAKAAAAVSQAADFPAGWKPVAEGDGGLNLETLWTELTGCLGVPAATPAGIATSPTYIRGLATQARSTVEYTSEASAAAVATALAGPKFQGCATTAFNADVKRSAPEGGVPGPVAVAQAKGAPVAPKSFAYRITAEVSLQELKVPLFQDFFVIFSNGAVIRALFLNPGNEFPQDLERSLLGKVVSRT